MLPFRPWLDGPLLLVLYVTWWNVIYFWGYAAAVQQRNDWKATVVGFSFRLALVIGLLGLTSYLTELGTYLLVMPLVILILALCAFDPVSVGLLLITDQFVRGFTDRDLMVLRPPPELPRKKPEASPLIGRIGVVTSNLRPRGYIDIDGAQLNAASDSGEFIDSGRTVVVTRFVNETAIVRCCDE